MSVPTIGSPLGQMDWRMARFPRRILSVAAFILALAVWFIPHSALAIAVGDRVQAVGGWTIRTTAAGTSTGSTTVSGTQGTVLNGPTYAALSGTYYNWYNINWDSGQDGWSIEASVTVVPASVPVSPSGLYAYGGSSAVGLGWNDNSNNETGFKIERKIGSGGTWVLYATLGANVGGFTDYSVSLGNTYYYRVYAYNATGPSPYYSNEASASLTAPPPSLTTNAASNVTTSSAQINGTVNPNGGNTTAYFQYGLTTSYGGATGSGSFGSGTSAIGIQSSLTSLASNTTYHYRAVATNSGGTSYGGDVTFTTLPAAPLPTVQTLAATAVTATSAQMNATVNPNGYSTTAYFQYGPTTSYGGTTNSASCGSGTSAISISNNGTYNYNSTFHYRVVATNSGGTTYGGDVTFTTLPLAGPPAILAPGLASSPGPALETLTPIFNWNSVSGATGYGLYIRDVTTDTLIYDNVGGAKSGTAFTLPSGYLSNNGHAYRWAMTSFNAGYESVQSSYLYFKAPTAAACTLNIASSNPGSGVYIYVGPDDNQGLADGTTSFSRIFNSGTSITLIAPTTAGGNNFVKWTLNGVDYSSSRTVDFTLSGNSTMTAVYSAALPVTHTVTVASSNPNSGVNISSSIPDNNTTFGGATPFTRIFNQNATATYIAPMSASGNTFQKWQLDGTDLTTSTIATVALNADHTLTAIYGASALNVALTSPCGGENWAAGSTQTVNWTVNGNTSSISYFLVAYSTDNFSNYTNVSSALTPGTRSFSWSLPSGLNSSSVKVRVRALDVNQVILTAGISNALAISPPTGTSSLTGFVYDSQSGRALGNATVTLGAYSQTTNSSGYYSFTRVASGSYALAASLSGYTTKSEIVALGTTLSKDITLAPDFQNNTTCTLFGYVRDAATGVPQSGVTVYLSNGTATDHVVSDSLGFYGFNSRVSGSYTVSVQPYSNYLFYSQSYSLYGAIEKDIDLPKSQIALGGKTNSGYSADPVNTATGNYIFSKVDLKLPGPGISFVFERNYNAQDGTNGPLGFGWNHTYNTQITFDSSNNATIRWGESKADTFKSDGNGGFISPQYVGVFDTLTAISGGGYTLLKRDQTRFIFNSSNRLSSIVDKNGNSLTLDYTGANLTTITDAAGRSLTFTYNSSNRISKITDPINRTIQYSYDVDGNLISTTDANGKSTAFTYDGNHHVLTVVDPLGNIVVTNTYDASGRVVLSQKDAKQGQTTYVYDEVNCKTTVTQPLGRVTVDYYDNYRRLVRQDDANSHSTLYAYDDAGNRISVTDKNGYTTAYSYDAFGNVTGKTNQLGASTSITYDPSNNPLSRMDELGNTTTFAYDANGNLNKTTDALGGIVTATYNSRGLPLTTSDSLLNQTSFAYDAQGNLTSVTDALSNVTTYTYDGVGRRLNTKDALNHVTTVAFDNNDNILSVTDPATKSIFYTYDGNNNKLTETDKGGNVTSYDYDVKDLPITSTDALGNTRSYAYDALDQKISVTDANGGITQYAYDLVGNPIMVTNALGKAIQYLYDANGNRISLTNPLGKTTTYTYDALNRLVQTTDPLGNSTSTEYDAVGRKTKVTDANSKFTTYTYDALGHLMTATDANGGIVQYTYDAAGNRKSMIDPSNHTTTYTYDALRRLLQSKDPLNGISINSYDTVGNLSSRKDPNGNTITYTYDVNNRHTGITYPSGTPVSFAYDANGNRTGMTDSVGASSCQYDKLNRMTSATDAYGKTVIYGYDGNGNRTSMTYPGNKLVTYSYDACNHMKSVTDWVSHVTTYNYDDAGYLVGTTNPNGTTATYGYDIAGRLTGLSNAKADSSLIANYTLTLDGVGNHTKSVQNEPLDPIIAENSISYSYDNDNRLAIAGSSACSYDVNGNMKTHGSDTYSYDFENRLIQDTIGGVVSKYQYDGIGNRKAVMVPAGTKRFVLDLNGSLTHVLADTDESGTVNAYYIYGCGLVSQISAANDSRYYHYDVRGSTIALSDPSGNLTDKYAFDPFGKIVNSQGSTQNPFKYVGKHGVMDEGNGLTYIRARYFTPDLGRFITKDPLSGTDGDGQSLNRYVYALNNPIILSDYDGRSPTLATAGLGALIGGTTGLIATAAGDAIRSAIHMNIEISSSSEYAQNIVGGTVGGFVTGLTLNPVLGGASGSYASESWRELLKGYETGDRQSPDIASLTVSAITGAATAGVADLLPKPVGAQATKLLTKYVTGQNTGYYYSQFLLDIFPDISKALFYPTPVSGAEITPSNTPTIPENIQVNAFRMQTYKK